MIVMLNVRRLGFVAAVVGSLFFGGCTASLQKAKKSAAVSKNVYTEVEKQVVAHIAEIVEKSRREQVTNADRERLGTLNDLRKLLDKFAELHNGYVSGLKLWESTSVKPASLDAQVGQMLAVIQEVESLAKRLQLKVGN